MANTNLIYNRFKGRNAAGTAPWSTSTLRTYQVLLIDSTGYSANKDDVTVATSLAASESTSTTYSRQTLGTLAVSTDQANDRAELDAADTTFTSINTGTVYGCAVIEVPTASTSDTGRFPVCWNDSTEGFPIATNGGNLTISWNANGLMTLT